MERNSNRPKGFGLSCTLPDSTWVPRADDVLTSSPPETRVKMYERPRSEHHDEVWMPQSRARELGYNVFGWMPAHGHGFLPPLPGGPNHSLVPARCSLFRASASATAPCSCNGAYVYECPRRKEHRMCACVPNNCSCKRPLTPPPRASVADQQQPSVKNRRLRRTSRLCLACSISSSPRALNGATVGVTPLADLSQTSTFSTVNRLSRCPLVAK